MNTQNPTGQIRPDSKPRAIGVFKLLDGKTGKGRKGTSEFIASAAIHGAIAEIEGIEATMLAFHKFMGPVGQGGAQ